MNELSYGDYNHSYAEIYCSDHDSDSSAYISAEYDLKYSNIWLNI